MDENVASFARPRLPHPGATFEEFLGAELGLPAAAAGRHLFLMRHLVPLVDGPLRDALEWWGMQRQMNLARQMAEETSLDSPRYVFLRGQAEEAGLLAGRLLHEGQVLDDLRAAYQEALRNEEEESDGFGQR